MVFVVADIESMQSPYGSSVFEKASSRFVFSAYVFAVGRSILLCCTDLARFYPAFLGQYTAGVEQLALKVGCVFT